LDSNKLLFHRIRIYPETYCRKIYYEDTPLYGSQRIVETIINRLEDYWKVPSSSFNVLAGWRGLFAGPVAITLRQSHSNDQAQVHTWGVHWIDSPPTSSRGDYLYKPEHTVDISEIEALHLDSACAVDWVLVVEKETIFDERVQELNRYKEQGDDLEGRGFGVIVTVRLDIKRFSGPDLAFCILKGYGYAAG
jgi:DNA topoisomerase VI subunit A